MNEQEVFLCNLLFVNLLFVLFFVLLAIYGKDFIYVMVLLVTIWITFYFFCCQTCHKIEQHSQINQKPIEKKETIHAEAKIKEIELIEIHTEKNSCKKVIVI